MSTFSKYRLHCSTVMLALHPVYTNCLCMCGYVKEPKVLPLGSTTLCTRSTFSVSSIPSRPKRVSSQVSASKNAIAKNVISRKKNPKTEKKQSNMAQANPEEKVGKSSKKDIKRLRIIEAAITVIAQKGYHSARMSDIAKSAGVADGTIYNYFQNKEHVLLCIFEEKMAELIDQLTSVLEKQREPLEKIRLFIRNHFEHLQQHPELGQVFQVELRQSQLFFHGYKPKRLFEYLSLLGNSIKEGQQQGILSSKLDSNLLQWSIFGTLDELSMNWVVSGRQWPMDLESLPDQIFDIFLKGIIRE